MPSFSVSSLLNQTTTSTSAVDQRSPLSSSRPAALDISNLLCSTTVASKVGRAPTTTTAMPLLASPTSSSNSNSMVPSPLSASSAHGFQLPPITHTTCWPAASAATAGHRYHHSALALPPPIPKPLTPTESNSIWMHDSMASSASSIASNTTLSSCGSIEPVTPAATPGSSSFTTTATNPQTLPLKKQQDFQQRYHHHHRSNSTKRAFFDEDPEGPCTTGALTMVSSDEESASPSSPPAVKAKRRRANAKQLEVLNRVFDRTVFPSTQLRAELGRQLGMTPRTVQIWFQNRRQAIRTREQQRLLRIVRDEHQRGDPSSS